MIRWLALLLALGGWLCRGEGDNPCLGAATCSLAVGDRCCPFASVAVCEDQCIYDGVEACGGPTYACRDEARLATCAFAATIDAISCTAVGETNLGSIEYLVEARGTLTGCGEELVYFGIGDQVVVDPFDCGSWTPGTFGGCVPDGDAPSTTSYAFSGLTLYQGDDKLDIVAAHGGTLASMLVTCH